MKQLISKFPCSHYLQRKWDACSGKDKIIYKNAAGAFAVKGFALLVSFFTLPAYMRYFDNQQIYHLLTLTLL